MAFLTPPAPKVTLPPWWGQGPAPGAGEGAQIERGEFGEIKLTDLLPVAIGEVRVEGKVFQLHNDIIDGQFVGVFCEGEIGSIENIRVNAGTVVTWTDPYGVFQRYVYPYTGASSDPDPSAFPYGGFSPAQYDLSGWAPKPACVKLSFYGRASGAAYPWYWQLGSASPAFSLAADVKGWKFYDPRTGLTVYTNNSALVWAGLLTRVGKVDPAAIDWESISGGAAQCEASGFTCNILFPEKTTLDAALAEVLLTCNGLRTSRNGKLALWIDGVNTGSPVAALDESKGNIWDLAYEWLPAQQRPTRVWVDFPNAAADGAMDSVKVPEEEPAILRERRVTVRGCTSTAQAKLLADYIFNVSAVPFRARGTIGWEALTIFQGDKVTVKTKIGINAPYLIEQIDEDASGFGPVILRPYDAAIYNSEPITQSPPVIPPTSGWDDTPPDIADLQASPDAKTGSFGSPTAVPAANLPQTSQSTGTDQVVTTKKLLTVDFTLETWAFGWTVIARWATGLTDEASFNAATWAAMSGNELLIPQGGNRQASAPNVLTLYLPALVGETVVDTPHPNNTPNTTVTTGGGWKLILRVVSAAGKVSTGVTLFRAPYTSSSSTPDPGTPAHVSDITLLEETLPAVSAAGKTIIAMDAADHIVKVSQNACAYVSLLNPAVLETPSGAVNGTNVNFTLAGALEPADMVFVDGIYDPDATAVSLALATSVAPRSGVRVIHFGLTIGGGLGGGVPTGRLIATTSPLSGGGDLSEDRTLAISSFAGSAAGAVPASGGEPYKYLRADGPWSEIGQTLRTLHETVFSSLTHGYLDGADYADTGDLGDGIAYQVYRSNAGGTHTLGIDGSGLTITATPSSTRQWLRINPGGAASGSIHDVVTRARFLRGGWAFWIYVPSYDFAYAGTTSNLHLALGVRGGTYGGLYASAPYLFGATRAKNTWGAPNTADGGLSFGRQFANGTLSTATIGASTHNVMMLYVRNPYRIDVFFGAWASGWPTMEGMMFAGTITISGGDYTFEAVSGGYLADLSAWAVYFCLDPSTVTSGHTVSAVIERWRITSWE